MAKAARVFLVGKSLEDGRPEIDFTLRENKKNDWLTIDQVLRGLRRTAEFPVVHVTVREPTALEWDCYSDGGGSVLLSQRATDLLRPHGSLFLDFIAAALNSVPYYFVRIRGTLDCLYRANSLIIPFRDDPTSVKEIKTFRFLKERIRDPLLFAIPELRVQLFATESVERLVRESGLRGLRFVDAERSS